MEKTDKHTKLQNVLITSPPNMRNAVGFTGEGIVWIGENDALVLTDSRYTIAAKEECKKAEVIEVSGNLYENWIKALLERVDRKKLSELSIGYEDERMTVHTYHAIQELFKKYDLSHAKLVPLHKELDARRQVKTESEIEKIQKAEKIGDIAFAKILETIKESRKNGTSLTEKQVAAYLEFFMKEQGAQGTSFDTIAASGIHSSMPHAVPTDKILTDGDFLTMDFGCRVDGYCSDMTRTIVIGKADEKQRNIYEIVLHAQKAGMEAVKAGKKGREVDAAARQIISAEGYGKCFGHSLGHSVGLEIHETPCFSSKDETVLKPGMVITVEPGIYVEGFGGVRIEDVVVVTEDGYKNLTTSPKNLIEI